MISHTQMYVKMKTVEIKKDVYITLDEGYS